MDLIHGNCVAIEGQGVLILGPSGSGKSDLSLRLIDEGARLVGDDQVYMFEKDDALFAQAPEKLQGLMEAHGIGIFQNLDFIQEAPINLVVELTPIADIERLPRRNVFTYGNTSVLRIKLNGFAPSTCAKIRAMLKGDLLPQDQLL
ncbi:MAG: HPr kinase/phosphatase C-terminal domain-containing protein [Sphingomonadales bacterium]|jgi:serine kinase of HPr protein (carbohydrate metabolism regulator)